MAHLDVVGYKEECHFDLIILVDLGRIKISIFIKKIGVLHFLIVSLPQLVTNSKLCQAQFQLAN